MGKGFSKRVILADLNGDGALDAGVTVSCSVFNIVTCLEIRLNDDQGAFSKVSQRIAQPKAQAYDLGDLDGDGDLDAFAGWYQGGYAIWWNRGDGTFSP